MSPEKAPKKKAAAKTAATSDADTKADPKPKRKGGAAGIAAALVEAKDSQGVLRYAAQLEDDKDSVANQAARVIQEVLQQRPEMVVPLIERFARLLAGPNKRVIQCCAAALPVLSRVAPAKVAKQLPTLTDNWSKTTDDGKDGLVRTFSGLCTASVAYQKRLEPALGRALSEAAPKTLVTWTEVVLPALKGEPHARARAVVEGRLGDIPRAQAQKIADFLGIKLRPLVR